MGTPLSETWPIPRFRMEGAPIPWVQQIRPLKEDITNNRVTEQICRITQIALGTWVAMSSVETRNALQKTCQNTLNCQRIM